MLHDDAFDFIFMGAMLERAGQTARILDVHHHALDQVPAHQVVETALWLAVLRACSGFEPFMKRFQGKASAATVARFLLLDARFPRSVNHALHGAAKRLSRARLPGPHGTRAFERLRTLEACVVDEGGPSIDAGKLHALLTHVVDETHAICDEIGRELLGAPTVSGDAVAQ
jgi:uncharacterized alpha-E superfamily protein